MGSFVSDEFDIPELLETDRFRMRMLTVDDVYLDYDAVMSSRERLRHVFSERDDWPADNMTLDENLKDLQRHQDEFLRREAFTYTVVNPDETKCLGCVYIRPTDKKHFDAAVFLWVIASEQNTGLDKELFETVRKWIAGIWPFKKVAFPGREIDWNEWKMIS